MGEIAFTFVASLLEAVMFCGILCILCPAYWKIWKIGLTAVISASLVTVADLLNIDMNTGLNIICLTMVLYLLYRERILDILFDTISGAMVCQLLQLIIILALTAVAPTVIEDEKSILSIMAILIAVIFCIRKFCKPIVSMQKWYYDYRRVIWIVLLNFSLIQIAYMYNWNETNAVTGSIIALIIIVIGTNLILVHQIVTMKRQEDVISQQQEMAASKEEFIKRMTAERHDFSKHIQLIKELAESSDGEAMEQIRSYADELIGQSQVNNSKNLYMGDSILSLYLTSKKKEAQEMGIRLNMLVRDPLPKIPCTRTELIVITGNLLDNALEAVDTLEGEERKIFFEIGKEKGKSLLQTINYLPKGSNFDQSQMLNERFSTKEGDQRGYGLSNIKAIAEKYQGEVEIGMNHEVIIIKVLFQ